MAFSDFITQKGEQYSRLSRREQFLVIFCAVIFACFVLLLIISGICSAVYHEPFLVSSSVFFQDAGDAFMDFFNVNKFVQNMDPYIGEGSSYPPLVLLIAKIFQLIQGSAETAAAVRLSVRGIVSLVIYLAIFFTAAWFLLRAYTKRYSISRGLCWMTFFALFVSSPMLYAIDRGNYLLYSFLLAGFFLLQYNSSKRWLRELSYAALAGAVGIKLYPAVFAFLLLNRKDWKGFVKTVVYSIVLVILPLFCFHGGFTANAKAFAGNLLDFSALDSGYYNLNGQTYPEYVPGAVFYLTGYYNCVSIPGVTVIMAALCMGLPVNEIPAGIGLAALAVAAVLAVVAVVAFYMSDKEWIRIFLLTSVMTFILKTNYEYSLIYFIFPLLSFIMSRDDPDPDVEPEMDTTRCRRAGLMCLVLFVLIFMCLPLGYTVPKYSHALQHGYPTLNFIQTLAYLAMTIYLIIISFRDRAEERRRQRLRNSPGNALPV